MTIDPYVIDEAKVAREAASAGEQLMQRCVSCQASPPELSAICTMAAANAIAATIVAQAALFPAGKPLDAPTRRLADAIAQTFRDRILNAVDQLTAAKGRTH